MGHGRGHGEKEEGGSESVSSGENEVATKVFLDDTAQISSDHPGAAKCGNVNQLRGKRKSHWTFGKGKFDRAHANIVGRYFA
jgi:hypothetical protein